MLRSPVACSRFPAKKRTIHAPTLCMHTASAVHNAGRSGCFRVPLVLSYPLGYLLGPRYTPRRFSQSCSNIFDQIKPLTSPRQALGISNSFGMFTRQHLGAHKLKVLLDASIVNGVLTGLKNIGTLLTLSFTGLTCTIL